MRAELFLNELSLRSTPLTNGLSTAPFADRYAAREGMKKLMNLLQTALDYDAGRGLRMIDGDIELAPQYLLSQWRIDKDVDKVERDLLRSHQTKMPSLAVQEQTLYEYQYKACVRPAAEVVALSLASEEFHRIAVSIQSHTEWDRDSLLVYRLHAQPSGTVEECQPSVRHASQEVHLHKHSQFLPKLLPYIIENRPARVEESFLNFAEYTKTEKRVKGSAVYQDAKGWYYHIDSDRKHSGRDSHIEFYDARGQHLGTLYPDRTYRSGPVAGRMLREG